MGNKVLDDRVSMEKDRRSILISSVYEDEGFVNGMMAKFSWANHKELADSAKKSYINEKQKGNGKGLPDLLAIFSLMT